MAARVQAQFTVHCIMSEITLRAIRPKIVPRGSEKSSVTTFQSCKNCCESARIQVAIPIFDLLNEYTVALQQLPDEATNAAKPATVDEFGDPLTTTQSIGLFSEPTTSTAAFSIKRFDPDLPISSSLEEGTQGALIDVILNGFDQIRLSLALYNYNRYLEAIQGLTLALQEITLPSNQVFDCANCCRQKVLTQGSKKITTSRHYRKRFRLL